MLLDVKKLDAHVSQNTSVEPCCVVGVVTSKKNDVKIRLTHAFACTAVHEE